MNGQMMQLPLLVSSLLVHAERHHPEQEVVSRRVEGDLHRYTFRELAQRARQGANMLATLGVGVGERVGTLAWNGYRHLELYYAASGSGAVINTINPRLHADQVAYIINHADDKVVFFDLSFWPLIQTIAERCPGVSAFVALAARTHMPEPGPLTRLLCYEDLLLAASAQYDWPLLDEQAACSLCYTSGTTGQPKGVLYSHRSSVLHTYGAALPDSLNCSSRDVILPVVPMYHVNAWGLPYIACMTGAKLVLPGPALDGKSLYELAEQEHVTLSAGVPTVWQGLLNHVRSQRLVFSSMKRTVIGGAACPRAMIAEFSERYGVQVTQGWGMTELSPLGTTGTLKAQHLALAPAYRYDVLARQGRAIFGIDMKVVGEDGQELPWDGVSVGDLMVRGPWVIERYYLDEGGSPLVDGWFPTGDVARIGPDGVMQITDRSKDVIKSGGEWIGSIEIENLAMAHPGVAQAACIGVLHPKWDERPLLVVVKAPGAELSFEEILAHFDGKMAKWWTPDAVVFVEEIPLGATGKMLKNRLRERYRNYLLEQE